MPLVLDMADQARRRVLLEVPWGTLFRIVTVVALAWLWLRLVEIALMLVVAILLAVTLMPLVSWLERHRLSRASAVAAVTVSFLILAGGFIVFTWSSLSVQG